MFGGSQPAPWRQGNAVSPVITATQTGPGAHNGMALNVRVLTGTYVDVTGPQYASYFSPGVASANSANPGSVTINPMYSNCWMYGAVNRNDAASAWTPIAVTNSIFDQNIADATNNATYGTYWSSGGAAPTFTPVQSTPVVFTNASLTSLTVTFSSPTTAGNTVVVCVASAATATTPAISGITLGGLSDNFASATGVNNLSGFASEAGIWYDPYCAGGQTSIVISFTGGSGTIYTLMAAAYEVPGVLTTDQPATNTGYNLSTWSSGTTLTTLKANEIFFGSVCTNSGTTVTGAGTWTSQTDSGGTYHSAMGYQVVSATGTATFSGTLSPSGTFAAVTVTFYGSGSGPFTAGVPVAIGASNSAASGGAACVEIPPMPGGGVVAEDPSAPAPVSTTSANTVSTARFTPPMGSLLVAMIATAGTNVGMQITDDNGMLAWVPLAYWASGTSGYAGVWAAVVVCG